MNSARSEGVRDLEIWNGNLEVRAYWRASEKAGGAPRHDHGCEGG